MLHQSRRKAEGFPFPMRYCSSWLTAERRRSPILLGKTSQNEPSIQLSWDIGEEVGHDSGATDSQCSYQILVFFSWIYVSSFGCMPWGWFPDTLYNILKYFSSVMLVSLGEQVHGASQSAKWKAKLHCLF